MLLFLPDLINKPVEKVFGLCLKSFCRIRAVIQLTAAFAPKILIRLLRRDPQAGILLRNAIPGHDAADPQLQRRCHRHRPVTQLVQTALQQIDGIHRHQRLYAALYPLSHLRHQVLIDNAVEQGQTLLVAEDLLSQLLAVQTALMSRISASSCSSIS